MKSKLRTTLIIMASIVGMAGLSAQANAYDRDQSFKRQLAVKHSGDRHERREHRGDRDRHDRREHRGDRHDRRVYSQRDHRGHAYGHFKHKHHKHHRHHRHDRRYVYDRGHWGYRHHRHINGLYIGTNGISLHIH